MAEAGVISWGRDSLSQLGLGDEGISRRPVLLPKTGVLENKWIVSAVLGAGGGLVLTQDGGLFGWGYYPGSGTGPSDVPVAVDMTGALAGKTVTAIGAGNNHFLVLTDDGQVFGWGYSYAGQLGQGDTATHVVPVRINGGALEGQTVIQIAVGTSHSMALTEGGKLVAWGSNSYGQIGDGSNETRYLPVAVNDSGVLSGVTVTGMSCGNDHTLAVGANGQVYAWGYNNSGKLGDGTSTARVSPVMVNQSGVMAGKAAVKVAAGVGHSLALTADGRVYAWGSGYRGSLGHNAMTSSSQPVAVEMGASLFGKQVVSLSAGYYSNVVLTADGEAFCWGNNDLGQMGDGSTLVQRLAPAPVYNKGVLEGEELIACSYRGSSSTPLAVTRTGKAVLWGQLRNGELGDGLKHLYQTAPHPIALESGHTKIRGMATGMELSMTITDDPSNAWRWGHESFVVLSASNQNASQTSIPRSVAELADTALSAVAVGRYHSMVLTEAGKVYAWGVNLSGQVGGGTLGGVSVAPRLVAGLLSTKTVTKIATGIDHCLALTADNKLYAWGAGTQGQLGNGDYASANGPVAVTMTGVMAGKTIIAIAAGSSHSLALSSDGRVFAWGSNGLGTLGTGPSVSQANPVEVDLSGLAPGSVATKIAAGAHHSLLITQEGRVYGWGSNAEGQLGLGYTGLPQMTPVAMDMTEALAGKQAAKVQGGVNFSVVLTTDGQVFTTGSNASGSLGTGDLTDSSVPVPILTTTAVAGHVISDIATGPTSWHVLALAVPTGPELYVGLMGGGIGPFEFGRARVGDSSGIRALPIFNRGPGLLLTESVTITGPDADYFQIEEFPYMLNGVRDEYALLQFGPDEDRIYDAVLEIASNDPVTPVFRLKLSGRGAVQPSVTLPSSTLLDPGQPMNLTVTPVGTGPFTYQWSKTSPFGLPVAIAGATGRSYVIPAVAQTDEALYSVTVTADLFQADSSAPTAQAQTRLDVTDPPTIGIPSYTSLTVNAGTHAILPSFFIEGTFPRTYRWEKDGVAVPGRISQSLQLIYVTPDQAGVYRLVVTNRAGSVKSEPIRVIVNSEVAPMITLQPVSAIGLAGSSHTLDPWIYGAPNLKFQWSKNLIKAAGATARTRVFAALTNADAGSYSLYCENGLGNVRTSLAHLSVLQPAPPTVAVKVGESFTLKAAVATPPESTVAYTWLKYGQPIAAEARISGLGTATFQMSGFARADEGSYECLVSVTARDGTMVQRSHGTTFVRAPQKPFVNPFTMPESFVGRPVVYQIAAFNYPDRYAITGLPAGLKFDAVRGTITGYPTEVKRVGGVVVPYVFTVTASNGAGTSEAATGSFLVQPLPSELTGSYAGLVGRSVVGNGNLGGTFKFTVATTGAVSGTLFWGGKTYPFTTSVAHNGQSGSTVTSDLLVDGEWTQFSATIGAADHTIQGTVGSSVYKAALTGHHVPWTTTNKPAAHAGAYNHGFSAGAEYAGLTGYPQGHGFAVLTVSATGTANWVGTLADGSAFTSSSQLSQQLSVPLHALVTNKTGSILGWSDLGAGPVTESMDWYKAAAPAKPMARSYKDGIPLHALTVTAAKYVKPATGEIVLGLAAVTSPATNAILSASDVGLNLAITVTNTNAVKLPAAAQNPLAVKLTLTPATGKMTGSFTLKDNDPRDGTPPYAQITRTVTYNGLLIPRHGFNRGLGHFNLAELPDAAGETAANTPMWSEGVELVRP